MNERVFNRIIWSGAAISVALGLVMTAQSAWRLRADSAELRRELASIGDLKLLARDMEERLAAQRVFESLPVKRPVPLSGIIKSKFSDETIERFRETRRESVGGWVVREAEISFKNLSISQVMTFAEQVEGSISKTPNPDADSAPPWRLTGCIINATPGASGMGHVTLTFEALEKSE